MSHNGHGEQSDEQLDIIRLLQGSQQMTKAMIMRMRWEVLAGIIRDLERDRTSNSILRGLKATIGQALAGEPSKRDPTVVYPTDPDAAYRALVAEVNRRP